MGLDLGHLGHGRLLAASSVVGSSVRGGGAHRGEGVVDGGQRPLVGDEQRQVAPDPQAPSMKARWADSSPRATAAATG